MTTLSRIRAAQPFDTIPAPALVPLASQPAPVAPFAPRDDAPPESRTLDSRRRDTIPAPPPEGVEAEGGEPVADDEAPPSTERAPFAMEQVG